MSFSSEVKEEISKITNLKDKEAVRFELIGYLISNNCTVSKNKIRFSTENEYNINRLNKLLINLDIYYDIELQGNIYIIKFEKEELKNIQELEINNQIITCNIEKQYIENENLVKSLVRGTFLGGGSINNPNNKYHLEIVFSNKENAIFVKTLLEIFYIKTKELKRDKGYSLYIKEGEEISKLLAMIGASKAVLKYEEIRVIRDTRNNVNRIVNCETANLSKTINAAVKQIEDIKLIQKLNKFEKMPEVLKEIANKRIENPDASLIELGNMLKEPVGKSGVNYRLKKIHEIAEELRKN